MIKYSQWILLSALVVTTGCDRLRSLTEKAGAAAPAPQSTPSPTDKVIGDGMTQQDAEDLARKFVEKSKESNQAADQLANQ